MTKIEEVELLYKMIRKFGPNSYIGPWLQSMQKTIMYCIANDLAIGSADDYIIGGRPKDSK